MKEYIEREDAVKHLKSRTGQFIDDVGKGWNAGIEASISYIEGLSAADVAEVRHGRWEWKEEWETHPETHSCDLISCGWYCSNCGIELGEYLTEKTGRYVCLDDDYCEPTLRRCPNCGARMDKEAEQDAD